MAKDKTRVIEVQRGIDDRWYWVLARKRDRKMLTLSAPHATPEKCFKRISKEKKKGTINKKLEVVLYTEFRMAVEMRHDTVP